MQTIYHVHNFCWLGHRLKCSWNWNGMESVLYSMSSFKYNMATLCCFACKPYHQNMFCWRLNRAFEKTLKIKYRDVNINDIQLLIIIGTIRWFSNPKNTVFTKLSGVKVKNIVPCLYVTQLRILKLYAVFYSLKVFIIN